MRPADTPREVVHHRRDGRLEILWGDGHRSVYPALVLRLRCPCAGCMSGGETRTRPAPPPGISVTGVEPVGNYAVALTFNDQHTAGVYRWEYLRYWCPCDTCWTRTQRELGQERPEDMPVEPSLCSPPGPPAAAGTAGPRPQPLRFRTR